MCRYLAVAVQVADRAMLEETTSAMARLVTVSFGSGMVSALVGIQRELGRSHYMIGRERLLDQCCPGIRIRTSPALPVMKSTGIGCPEQID